MGKGSVPHSWIGGASCRCEEVHETTQMEHENETATDDAAECPSDRTRSEEPSRAANVPSTRSPANPDVDAAAASAISTAATTAAA